MTRTFHARFANGVLVPSEKVELPVNRELTVTVEEPVPSGATPAQMPRYDDPEDPMPQGGVAMIDWWARHRLPIDPVIGDKIARSKAYGFYEEPEDDA